MIFYRYFYCSQNIEFRQINPFFEKTPGLGICVGLKITIFKFLNESDISRLK